MAKKTERILAELVPADIPQEEKKKASEIESLLGEIMLDINEKLKKRYHAIDNATGHKLQKTSLKKWADEYRTTPRNIIMEFPSVDLIRIVVHKYKPLISVIENNPKNDWLREKKVSHMVEILTTENKAEHGWYKSENFSAQVICSKDMLSELLLDIITDVAAYNSMTKLGTDKMLPLKQVASRMKTNYILKFERDTIYGAVHEDSGYTSLASFCYKKTETGNPVFDPKKFIRLWRGFSNYLSKQSQSELGIIKNEKELLILLQKKTKRKINPKNLRIIKSLLKGSYYAVIYTKKAKLQEDILRIRRSFNTKRLTLNKVCIVSANELDDVLKSRHLVKIFGFTI